MGTDSWVARQAAVEGSYFRTEQVHATRKHLERMVTEGRASTEIMEALQRLGIQSGEELRARSSLPEHRMKFKYVESEFPSEPPHPKPSFSLMRHNRCKPKLTLYHLRGGMRQEPGTRAMLSFTVNFNTVAHMTCCRSLSISTLLFT